MTGIFLQLSRVLPDQYPLSDELRFGRLLDFGVILPRLQELDRWSALELSAPELLEYTRDGALTYAWPFEERDVWKPATSFAIELVRRALPPGR
jgi:hypothetical protein